MLGINMYWHLAVVATIVVNVFIRLVHCDYYFRSSKVKELPICSLQEFFHETVTKSELHCKFRCLQHANCVASQWDPASGNCQLQDSLHIVPSTSAGDTVVLMMDEDLPVTCATDCADILATDPSSESGVYHIFVGGQILKQVWCDMDTDGGGWTVFVKRFNGSVDFYQDHAAYREGFGDVSGEHWLGLDTIHAMTSTKTYQLRADMSDWDDDTAYSLHESMLVGNESQDYKLNLGAFLGGEGGDGLVFNQGKKFSTKDRELDSDSDRHCARSYFGGWWYNACSKCHVTSRYYNGGKYSGSVNDGMQWGSWSKHLDDQFYSLKTLELKLRP